MKGIASMNGYLVVIRHACDDIPLLLTNDEIEAMDFAAKVNEDDGEAEKKLLGIDAATQCNASVYKFSGGKLCDHQVVRDFQDEN